MYLLQANITGNISEISFSNWIVLFIGAAVLLIIIAVIFKKLGVTSLGPIKIEQRGQTTMHDMNEKIKDIDDLCRRQMQNITDRMKINISNIFADMNICVPSRVAISSAIRAPMFQSITNNHFTTELMPERYPAYRKRIIENLKEEYVSLAKASRDKECTRDALPPWEEMKELLTESVDQWLERISREVMDACEKKVEVYKNYQKKYVVSKDEFRTEIAKDCIEKNERYIRELKNRINRETA